MLVFFFFKQKTAYEMRISDWSSDVCSSDLVKFRFPNKHDIYMHDTPQRELFEKTQRTFSHGCIRVHNPGRLAEILLEEDKGWSAARVRELKIGRASGRERVCKYV